MLKLFRKLEKKDYIYAVISVCLIVLQVFLDLKMPDYMSEITVLVQSESSNLNEVLKNGGYMLLVAFGSMIAAIVTGYFMSSIAADFFKNVGKSMFDKITNFGSAEIHSFKTASLITRNTNDITQVQMFLSRGLQILIKAPITAVWAITKIVNKSWQWSVATSVAVVVILGVVGSIMVVVVPKFKLVQQMIDRLNLVTRESLNGIRVIRAFNAKDYQNNKFKSANENLTDLQLFNQKMFSILMPMMMLVMNCLALSIYFIGAKLISDASIVDKIPIFGDMIVFSSYAIRVIMSFLMLTMIFMILPRANVSAKRINEVLEKEVDVKDGDMTLKDTDVLGKVEFKNVDFKYPDAKDYILRDISFVVDSGETVAFVGSTGSGKSTLIDLIPRFYDATNGSIMVDDVNVKDYKLYDLYNKIGYVSQKAVLFNDTVFNNIRYGKSDKSITEKDVEDALRVSQASTFVNNMEDGADTVLAQGGTNVSGGQKQRLSIARAIARKPEIFIFDDSFSALDYKTDATLRNELKKFTSNSTKIIVAQRIGTVMNADKIIVLDDGRIVGNGTHDELIKTCKVYQEIAKSQLSEEELLNAKTR